MKAIIPKHNFLTNTDSFRIYCQIDLEQPMPRALTDGGRIELRLRPEDKATLTRAAALKRLDLTGYIVRNVLPKAEAELAAAERLSLSERDSLRVLDLLENPPMAPDRLVRAAKAGFTLS